MKAYLTTLIALVLILPSCKKDEAKRTQATAEVPPPVEEAAIREIPAEHLGFARHVPSDADLFLAGYGADEMIRTHFQALFKSNYLKSKKLLLEEGQEEEPVEPSIDEDIATSIDKAIPYFGDEVFLFIGEGPGEMIEVATSSYRDLTAASFSMIVGGALESANGGEPLAALNGDEEELLAGMLENIFQVVQKDSSLRFPSMVGGWKPYPEKQEECLKAVGALLEEMMTESPTMRPFSFESSGVQMNGFQGSGGELFADMIDEARLQLEDETQRAQMEEVLSNERVEELLEALENFEFTIACGQLDDYLLIYLGNGSDGFRLAESPDDSLASLPALTWTSPFSEKTLTSFAYASDSFVKAWLPLIDSGPYWDALSKTVGPPMENARVFSGLLENLAETEHQLAERQTSPWSGIVVLDEGLRIESRGGWTSPDLDYKTPLQLTGAASAANPAIRAHWIQDRSRNNLKWQQVEQFGSIFQFVFDTFQNGDSGIIPKVPEDLAKQVTEVVRNFNRTYRDDFRNGIGDEAAFIVDFHGMTPPVPGIPEEIVSELELPRFLLARPVTDREKLAASSDAIIRNTHELITLANKTGDLMIPLLEPQLLESNEFDTWYFPLPISGGDFIPGISINDQLWMVGTSRSMAKSFSDLPPSTGNETGVIIDVDFEAIGQWLRNTYQLTKEQADALGESAPDMAKDLATDENLDSLSKGFTRLKGFHYRHWMEGTSPRSSYHLHIAPEGPAEK
jgi:hypothetical protein